MNFIVRYPTHLHISKITHVPIIALVTFAPFASFAVAFWFCLFVP